MTQQEHPPKHKEKTCGVYVSSVLVSYPCTLPQGHTEKHPEDPEPHYAVEVHRSVAAWQQWKRRHPDQPAEEPFVATAVGGGAVSEETSEEEELPLNAHCGLGGCPIPGPHGHGTDIPGVGQPTKQRDGDQRLPDADEDQVDDFVLYGQDIEARRQVGIERYGQAHRPFNGRNTLLDAYEEVLDTGLYLRSLLRMAEADRETLIEAVEVALKKHYHDGGSLTPDAQAPLAVDRIMGWVVSQKTAVPGIPDEILQSLIIDGIHEGIHAEVSWGETADHIVRKIRDHQENSR